MRGRCWGWGMAGVVILLSFGGCVAAPGHRGVLTEEVARRVTVYYATDREAVSTTPGQVEYGWKRAYLGGDTPYQLGVSRVEIKRRRNHDHEGPLPRMRLELVRLLSSTALDSEGFYDRIRENMWNASANETFVFVHGYNTDFEDAVKRTAELWYDIGFEGPPIMFSWASRGGSFWRGLFGYFADAETIEWSAGHLKIFLQELVAETSADRLLSDQPARIHLIAHSMGCRAVTRALALIARDLEEGDRPIFCDVILAAPDIDRDVLRDVIVPELFAPPVAEHFTLYASSSDVMIGVSEALQVYPRAGNADGRAVVLEADEFDTIDASAIHEGQFDLHHDYFVSKPQMIRDLIEILIRGNRDPSSPGRWMRRRAPGADQPWVLAPRERPLEQAAVEDAYRE